LTIWVRVEDTETLVSSTTPDHSSDFALLTAWRDGSEAAADALMRRHYPSVRRFFDLRAPQQADDLTQQTFLGAVEGLQRFRGDAKFRTFLLSIAHKQLLRQLREQERGPRLRRFTTDAGPKTSLSVVAVRQQEHRLLLMALAQLPVDLQLVVELYYWEELKAVEIAEVLELNPSTVTSRLARARQLLGENITAMTRPGSLRDRLLADLDGWSKALGPLTMAANVQREVE
jgi:RNA polymerase sigma factor (sigma-70 family)